MNIVHCTVNIFLLKHMGQNKMAVTKTRKREKTSGKGYSRDPDHRIPVTYFNIYKKYLKILP